MADVDMRSVSKSFGDNEVIHSVDLQVEDNEFMVFVGPSGCGKSTLLRLIAGLEDVNQGEISIGGERVEHLPPAKRGIAMVFQSYALYPHMTVFENMSFGLRLAKAKKDFIQQRVQEAAEVLQITELLQRKPKELSGGQRQRVAIGRAIVREPKVFLFDEPLSNLDAKLRVQMRIELTKLHQKLNATMIYVTHDQVEAMTMGHRIAVLNQGRLQQLGTPMELYRWPSNLFVAQFIGSPPMNVLPIQVGGGSTLMLGDRKLLVEGPVAAALPALAGQTLSAGIRPEHLQLAPATNRNLPAEVCHSEVLGNEQLVTCRLLDCDHLVQVRAEPNLQLPAGSSVHLAANPQSWRLFDANGEAIRLPEPPPTPGPEPTLPSL